MNKTNEIFNIAKRDGWVVEYDSDLDTFYWSKPIISDDTITMQYSEDFSLYITKKGLIEGLFIEYAKYNFVSHNTQYKPLFDNLVPGKNENDVYTLRPENAKAFEPLLKEMSNMVANETPDAVIKGVDLKNLVSA